MKKSLNCISIVLIFLLMISGSVFADLNDSLVAYYPFNGNANDESGNSNDGTVNGATLTTDRFGNENSAYSFDGVGDYISIQNSSALQQENITMQAFIYMSSFDGYYAIVRKHYGGGKASFCLGVTSENNTLHPRELYACINCGLADCGNLYSNIQIEQETWYSVACTYNGEELKLFINGELDSVEPCSYTIHYDQNNIGIGADYFENVHYLHGKIDDMYFYSRALTESEIDSLYHEGGWDLDTTPPGTPQNLTATPGNQQITLRWDLNTESDLHKYNIYCDTSSPATILIDSCVASSPPDTFYTDTGLTNGQIYYYRVTTVDNSGNESGYSDEIRSIPVFNDEYIPDANTIALWHLNEGMGITVYDATSNNHDGIVTNPTWLAQGKYGSAIEFAPLTGRLDLPNTESLNFSNQLTIEFWVFPITTGDLIANKNGTTEINGDFQLHLQSTSIDFDWWTSDNVHIGPISTTGNLSRNKWSHVALVLDDLSDIGKIYINGLLDKEFTFSPNIVGNTKTLYAGGRIYNGSPIYSLDGYLDEIRISNIIRTDFNVDLPPSIPQNFTATPGNQQITLRWNQNTESDLHKYNIYRDTSSPVITLINSIVGAPPDTFYVDTGLINGQTYYYRITAVDDTGNESGFSNEVSSSPTQFHAITTGPFVNDVGVGGGGLSWGDYDNDGDLDLFAASGVHNNVLYNNDGNGSLTEVTTGPIVTEGGHSIGGSWGDYDNDGYLDLFVANEVSQVNFLYHNNGDGTFSKVTTGHIVTTGVTSYGGSWADYDNDGDIDLFVANVGLNYLYKNDGVGNFSLVTDGSVVTDGPSTHSTTGSWADYNNDRYLDLFVTNGGGENNFLYMNNGDTTFTKITSGAVVTDGGGSYCGSWADYNNDGYLDLFVVNALDEDNFLYENNKDGTFTKVTDGSVVSDGGWSHGCGWADYNNDGYIDLFVANFNYDNNFSYEDFLYTNNGDGTFTRLAAGPIVADSSNSIGVAWADYDKDGDLDLFITGGGNEENLIYINDGTDNNWININALGINNAPSIGARVRIKALLDGTNSTWQMQEIASLTSYGSHGSFNAEFGLGVATIIDSIIIKWPSGIIWDSANVNVNQFITVYEPNQQSGLIAYYPFNGNANDESGNGNDGTVNGATLTTDRFGNANSAYSFDGVDDYIISEIGNIGTMGLSFWYKSSFPDPDVEWPHFFWYNNSYCCMYSFSKPGQEGYIYSRKQLADNSGYHVVTDYSPLFDTWHHVFVQYDSTNNNLKLYIDGTNMFNGIYTNDGGYHPISQNDTIYWGYWGAPLNLTSFKGSLDDIIIFNCILDSATIDSLYHVGSREENIIITVDSLIAFIGDTVSVPINVGFFTGKYYDSAELKFSGYQNGLEFIGVDTSSSMTGGAGWSNAVNETGDSLIISWFAGAEDISGSGVFCRLKFVATGEPCNFVPINIESALFNTGGDPVSITNGGVYIKPIPFYGDVDSNGEIQAHDAALTLKHVIEVETLDCQGLANADVTLNDTVTALDASIILQYGVGLIDSLPYDTLNGNLLAKGSITMKDGNYVPGQVVEVPLTLSGGSNILSFEGSLSYRPEQLVYSDIEWSHVTEGFLIEVNESDGKLVFAGAGSAPDGESGVFATVRFVINASFSGGETTVSLDELRWNEGAVKYDVAVSTLSRVAAIDFDISGIPAEYSLSQNYPNPFNPVTTIQYAIPEKSHVTLTIYNIAGQALEILENQLKEPGYYSVQWDASKIGSGVYIYEIQADEFRSVKKCVILK